MVALQQSASASHDDVASRIRDSLTFLEEVGEPLDTWQSDMLARALAYLRTETYALAIDVAFRACRPNLIGLSGGPTVTVAEMRAELDRVLAGE